MAPPRRPGAKAALLLAALALVPRCACDSVPGDAIEECEASQVVPGAVATDILFVIDDSGSMDEEQQLLRDGLAAFIQALSASPVANDFQIGVTTTSVADFDGDPRPPGGDLVGPVLSGASPTLVQDFQAQVLVGIAGSPREQPFEAARLALVKSEAGGPNEGFLRPGARLAIVFLSDEDDCSGPLDTGSTPIVTSLDCREEKVDPASTLLSIGDLTTFLSSPIAGEARDVTVAAIVGVAPVTLAPSCGFSYCADQTCGTAQDKGDRFIALLDAVGPSRTRLASICDPTFDEALTDFADVIASQTLPLDGAPGDWRMLVVRLDRPGVGLVGCTVAHAEDPTSGGADAVYEPPRPGRSASLTFQHGCELEPGDRILVDVVCVR